MTTPAVETVAFKAPNVSAAVKRALSDHLGDVLNVKSFGALGNGLHDDTANIQLCFDTAFGPSSSPHGIADAHLNKPVFFPPGIYNISTPLTLKDIYGAVMYGSGWNSTTIHNTSSGSSGRCLLIDGAKHCCFRDFLIEPSANQYAVDLDWTGTDPIDPETQVGMGQNIFTNMGMGSGEADSGIRIGNSTDTEGAGNQFIKCGTHLWIMGDGCLNQLNMGGSMGAHLTGGSFHSICGAVGGGEEPLSIINPTGPCSVIGCRGELAAGTFLHLTNGIVYFSAIHSNEPFASGPGLAVMSGDATLVMDSCYFPGTSIITADSTDCKLYLRACGLDSGALTGFTGTIVENI